MADKRETLEQFAKIIKEQGMISAVVYDTLRTEKPSRRTLYNLFGKWRDALTEAVNYLADNGEEVKVNAEQTVVDNSVVEAEKQVRKLQQQVQELTRHIQTPKLCLEGTTHKFGVVSDNHMGSLYCDYALLNYAYDVFEKEGIEIVLNAGDLVDGINMFKGHSFELGYQGADKQAELVKERYPKKDGMITYFICGNHDYSFYKHGGLDIGKLISKERADLINIGHQEADIKVGKGDSTATIRLSHPSGGTAYAICYDKDTEILTNEGWKLFKDLNKTEQVCTLNPKTLEMEFQNPIEYTDMEYNGPMKQFLGARYDLLVTPNHRMFVKRKWKNEWEIIEAKDITKGRQWSLCRNFPKWRGEIDESHIFPIPKVVPKRNGKLKYNVDGIPARLFVQFLGWYLSEGNIGHSNQCVEINQCKKVHPEYCEEIIRLITEMGYGFYQTDTKIKITSVQLYEYFKQFGNSYEKAIPTEVKKCNKELLWLLLETLFKGDGSYIRGKIRNFRTTSKQLADDIQEIALKCGLGCTIKKYSKEERNRTSNFKHTTDSYRLSLSYEHVEPSIYKVETIDYNDRIYCVSTPNGIVLIRRNGKVVWCGNSYNIQRYISELAPGTKPDILITGHYHKMEALQYRGVSALQPGTTQAQTPFMRGKKISASMGFCIMEVTIVPDRVISVGVRFFPVRT
jgi:predicted MPP superfamily phosphohydrolase